MKPLFEIDNDDDDTSLRSQNLALGPQKPFIGDEKKLIQTGIIIGVIFAVWKLYIAATANVIWEEGHFAVSGMHPALGYPDIPSGFALLSRLVTLIFGWHVLPLRILALIITAALPLGIYFMTSSTLTRRNAIWAAILSMFLPPLSFSGTIFYPEGLLQLLEALMLGCFIRAIDKNSWKWWGLTGLCAALGLFVHFRFIIIGLGIVIFALSTQSGRRLWFSREYGIKFWSVAGFALLGLLPSIIYNAQNDWPAIAFHVVNRPLWRISSSPFMSFLNLQIVLLTPVFFIIMGLGIRKLFKDQDRHPHLVLLTITGLTIFGIYLVQAPANNKIMPHWPFMAYVPLMALLPQTMIGLADAASSRIKRFLLSASFALGLIICVVLGVGMSVYEWAWANSSQIPVSWRKLNSLDNDNWALAIPDISSAEILAKQRFGDDIQLAAAGHIAAVRLEIAHASLNKALHPIYTLNSPDDDYTRFSTARKSWGLDLNALRQTHQSKGVVLILPQPSYLYHTPKELEFRQKLCSQFEQIEAYKIVTLPPGRTLIELYTARITPPSQRKIAPANCVLMPALYIAQPLPGRFIKAKKDSNYFGMAADPKGIISVDILIDQQSIGPANYGLNPKESPAPAWLSYDPNYPNVQFDFKLNKTHIKKGEHSLSIEATKSDGTKLRSQPRTIYIE